MLSVFLTMELNVVRFFEIDSPIGPVWKREEDISGVHKSLNEIWTVALNRRNVHMTISRECSLVIYYHRPPTTGRGVGSGSESAVIGMGMDYGVNMWTELSVHRDSADRCEAAESSKSCHCVFSDTETEHVILFPFPFFLIIKVIRLKKKKKRGRQDQMVWNSPRPNLKSFSSAISHFIFFTGMLKNIKRIRGTKSFINQNRWSSEIILVTKS